MFTQGKPSPRFIPRLLSLYQYRKFIGMLQKASTYASENEKVNRA